MADHLEARLDELTCMVHQILYRNQQQQFGSPQYYPQEQFQNSWCDPAYYPPQEQFQQSWSGPPPCYSQELQQSWYDSPCYYPQEEFQQSWSDPPPCYTQELQQSWYESPQSLLTLEDLVNQMVAENEEGQKAIISDLKSIQAQMQDLTARIAQVQPKVDGSSDISELEADAVLDVGVDSSACSDFDGSVHTDANGPLYADVEADLHVDAESSSYTKAETNSDVEIAICLSHSNCDGPADSKDEDNQQEISLSQRTNESVKMYDGEGENKLLDDCKKCFVGHEVKKLNVGCGSKVSLFPQQKLLINLEIFDQGVLIGETFNCKEPASLEEYYLKPLPKPPDKELIVACTNFSFTLISGGTDAVKKYSLKLNIVMSHAEGARIQFGFVKMVTYDIPPKPPDLCIVVVVPQDYELPLNARPPPDPGDTTFKGFMHQDQGVSLLLLTFITLITFMLHWDNV